MIVDLIRNDIGRIADVGSVAVTSLFDVETFPTLHTMTSTIKAQVRSGVTPTGTIKAMFPCGSVTGAPKIRAMEILSELESSPRGTYCGAIGYYAPDGAAKFNVAIRTITISGNDGELGVGGGIVQDSTVDQEFAECLLKARFFENNRPRLELIETLRFDREFVRLNSHLERMEQSARIFGFPFRGEQAHEALNRAVLNQIGARRVRLTLDETGLFQAAATQLPPNPSHWTFAISSKSTESFDPFLKHKTSWRQLYEQEANRYQTDEVLFLNEHGYLTEGARSNIFVQRDGVLLTPPLEVGALEGCLRRELIEIGAAREAILLPADLEAHVFLGNSLRGLIPGVRTQG